MSQCAPKRPNHPHKSCPSLPQSVVLTNMLIYHSPAYLNTGVRLLNTHECAEFTQKLTGHWLAALQNKLIRYKVQEISLSGRKSNLDSPNPILVL